MMRQGMDTFALHPRLKSDSVFVRDLGLSQLRLQNQRTLPWLVLVPRWANVTEIHDLSGENRTQLMDEIAKASTTLAALFRPDKINVGALGNIVPQLHIHVIARFTNDPAWPGPVWGALPAAPYEAEDLAETIARLNDETLWR